MFSIYSQVFVRKNFSENNVFFRFLSGLGWLKEFRSNSICDLSESAKTFYHKNNVDNISE